MASDSRCKWCNSVGAQSWTKTQGRDELVSEEKFCCLKCKTEYENKYGIVWIKKKNTNSGCLFLLIIIVIAMYYFVAENGNRTSSTRPNSEYNLTDNNKSNSAVMENSENKRNDYNATEEINSNNVVQKQVKFRNETDNTIYLAVAFFDNNLSDWNSIGWFEVKPLGDFVYPLPKYFDGGEIYFYGDKYDNSNNIEASYEGSEGFFCLEYGKEFNLRDNECEQSQKKGFRKISLHNDITEQQLLE